MRSVILALGVLSGLALSAPVAAQDNVRPPAVELRADDTELSDLRDMLSDPQKQRELGLMLQTVSEILLDVPLAPLAKAAAEIAGQDAGSVDPHMTIRSVAPEASAISERIGEDVPRAMAAVARLADGFEAVMPALRAMAEQVKDSAPPE